MTAPDPYDVEALADDARAAGYAVGYSSPPRPGRPYLTLTPLGDRRPETVVALPDAGAVRRFLAGAWAQTMMREAA